MKINLVKQLSGILSVVVIPAPIIWIFSPQETGQQHREALPCVVTIAVPTYPPLARAAHVQGVVHMKITTDGQRVTTAEVLDGPKVLAVPAQDNVQTWHFSPHDPTTFTVIYNFKLLAGGKGNTATPSVVLKLPAEVEVSDRPRETIDLAPDRSEKR